MLLLLLACVSKDADSTQPDNDTGDTAPTGDTADSTADSAELPSGLLGPFLDGDCDPIVPELCGLPFPSNVYLVPDTTTTTGARVHFGPTTLPRNNTGVQSDPAILNAADGYSPAAGPIVFLPGATSAGFAGPNDPGHSLDDDSPTILLDAGTGERIAHFAELDQSHADDSRRAILLRPVSLLQPGHRYIVALRGVVDAAGAPIAPSPAFLALRDGTPFEDPSIERRRALYADIYAHLAEVGVSSADLQLAWDFTVASRGSLTDRLVHMRDVALGSLGPSGASYTFTEVSTAPDASLALRIEGTVSVPLFLDQAGPGGCLTLGDDGLPVQNGSADYPFVMLVPNACAGRTCPIVQYGHGLFGSRYSIDEAGYHEAADAFGAVVISMDWTGMSGEDLGVLAAAAASGDIARFSTIPDRSQQAMVNLAVALRTLETGMAADPLLLLDGVPAVDPDTRYYLGGSQGGIYGATYMAVTPDIERGVLVVPGVAYSLMLPRSVYWSSYATPFIVSNFEDPRDVQLVLGYVQMMWDRAEPSGYVTAITDDPFPGTMSHRVLLIEGVGDHQVPNLSTEVLARSIGASYLASGNQTLFGLPEVQGPVETGNTLLDYSYGLPPVPEQNVPMEEGEDPHGLVFFEPTAQQSIFTFLQTGLATNVCDGPCDPN